MKTTNEKICANPSCSKRFKPRFKTTERTCSFECEIQFQKTKPQKDKKHYTIPRTSKKRSKEEKVYTAKRIVFLLKPENKICKINGSNCTVKATTIEHSMGRIGYADENKREKNISLYLDTDFWVPACLNCNLELENNPELSKKHQFSKIHGDKKQ